MKLRLNSAKAEAQTSSLGLAELGNIVTESLKQLSLENVMLVIY